MANEPRYVMFASDEPKPMGERLLEYARPLVDTLPADHTLDELKATVIFAALVWNVGIFDEVRDAVVYLERRRWGSSVRRRPSCPCPLTRSQQAAGFIERSGPPARDVDVGPLLYDGRR
jgi:hypothetical protein